MYKNFRSAYKLFDLSVIFIEKSMELIKENGYISFILPNKFLSADYGIKIRELLIGNTEIRVIDNISSLPIFQKAATYPIILYFKKGIALDKNEIIVRIFNDIDDLLTCNGSKLIHLPQKLINDLPSNVIPILGNISLIKFLYSNILQKKSEIAITLLNNKNDENRIKGLSIYLKNKTIKEIENFLSKYIAQGTYYYNIISWIDKLLYTKGIFRKYYKKSISEIIK